MTKRKTPLGIMLLLFFLFFVGLALNVLIILDVTWLQLYLVPRIETGTSVQDAQADELRDTTGETLD